MHRPVLLAASVFLGFASIVVALASASLPAHGITQVSQAPVGVPVVTRYYQAVNHLIATGDPSSLREVVHPDAVDKKAPRTGALRGLQGIERYVTFLHNAIPGVQLDAEVIAEHRSEVTALVQVRVPSPSVALGFSLDDRSVLWPEVERFRVVDGRIVERTASWDGMATLAFASTQEFHVEFSEKRHVTVSLDTYAPEAQEFHLPYFAPDMQMTLTGEVAIRPAKLPSHLGPMASVYGTGSDPPTLEPGGAEIVSSGTLLAMAAHSGYHVINVGHQPASLLHAEITVEAESFESLELQSTAPSPGLIGQALARFELESEDHGATFAFGQASLMPGGRLHVDPTARYLIACAVTGIVRCNAFEPGNGHVRAVRLDPYEDQSLAYGSTGLLIEDAGEGVLANAGSQPMTVWILAITVDPPSF